MSNPTYDRASRWRRLLVRASCAFILVIVLAFMGGLERGRFYGVCRHCGATRWFRWVGCFGKEQRYDVRESEGVLSRFLQERWGCACDHEWGMADETVRRFSFSDPGYGATGTCFGQYKWSTMFDWDPQGIVLQRRMVGDPAFFDQLVQAFSTEDEESYDFFDDLRFELFELEDELHVRNGD